MTKNKYTGSYEQKEEDVFSHLFMNYSSEAPSMTKDTPNWVAKFIYDKDEKMIKHPRKFKEESVLIMIGNVPNVLEFEKDRMIMVAS